MPDRTVMDMIDRQDSYLPRRVLSNWLGGMGHCMVCAKYKKLQIDHNHDTDNFRGLLCRECNLALGLFFDDTNILQRAIMYLRRSTVDA